MFRLPGTCSVTPASSISADLFPTNWAAKLLSRISGRSLHPTGDASLGYIEAQHEELTVDAGSTRVGFSATIRKIRSQTSFDNLFLPTCFFTFEIKLQSSRNSARCQRTTVSGVTTRSGFFQSDQNRRARTQKSLSIGRSLARGCLRLSRASCCRSAKFSKSSVRCERKQRATSPTHRRKKRNKGRTVIANWRVEEVVQTVDFRAGQSFGEAQY